MTSARTKTVQGALWAAVAIFMWSGSLVLLRLGVSTHLNAYDLTALRFGTAGILLLPVIGKKGFGLDRLGIVFAVLLILCFGAFYILLVSESLVTASASAAGALNPGIMAISVVLFSTLVFKDRTGFPRLFGVVLILLGVMFQVFWGTSGLVTGHWLLAVTGIMWAVYAAIVRHTGIEALHATSIVAVGSAVLYLPIYAFALPKHVFDAPLPDVVLQAVFQGVLVSFLAVYAFNRSAELLGPVIGSTLPALIPIMTLILAWITLDETLQTKELIVALVIGSGVALVLVKGKRSVGRGLPSLQEPR